MRKPRKQKCKSCGVEFETVEKQAKFCSRSCSTAHNNRKRKPTTDTRNKISKALKKQFATGERKQDKEKLSLAVGESTKGKFRENYPETILALSKRTVAKILKRLNIGCSICGWKEGSCDIHHINGRKIENCDAHENLCILCPNHHRLAHQKKITKETLINFKVMIGERWKEFYYG